MRGRPFQPGNRASRGRGRPKGALKKVNRELASQCRDILTPRLEEIAIELLESDDERVRLDAMRWLAERGWGKAPAELRLGLSPTSPEAILLRMAGADLPGQTEDDE